MEEEKKLPTELEQQWDFLFQHTQGRAILSQEVEEQNRNRIDSVDFQPHFLWSSQDMKQQVEFRDAVRLLLQQPEEEEEQHTTVEYSSLGAYLQALRKETKNVDKGWWERVRQLPTPPRKDCTFRPSTSWHDLCRLEPGQYSYFEGIRVYMYLSNSEQGGGLSRHSEQKHWKVFQEPSFFWNKEELTVEVTAEPVLEDGPERTMGMARASITRLTSTLQIHGIASAELPFPFSYSFGKLMMALLVRYAVSQQVRTVTQTVWHPSPTMVQRLEQAGAQMGQEWVRREGKVVWKHTRPAWFALQLESWSKSAYARAVQVFRALQVEPYTLFSKPGLSAWLGLYHMHELPPEQRYTLAFEEDDQLRRIERLYQRKQQAWRWTEALEETTSRMSYLVRTPDMLKLAALFFLLTGLLMYEHDETIFSNVLSSSSDTRFPLYQYLVRDRSPSLAFRDRFAYPPDISVSSAYFFKEETKEEEEHTTAKEQDARSDYRIYNDLLQKAYPHFQNGSETLDRSSPEYQKVWDLVDAFLKFKPHTEQELNLKRTLKRLCAQFASRAEQYSLSLHAFDRLLLETSQAVYTALSTYYNSEHASPDSLVYFLELVSRRLEAVNTPWYRREKISSTFNHALRSSMLQIRRTQDPEWNLVLEVLQSIHFTTHQTIRISRAVQDGVLMLVDFITSVMSLGFSVLGGVLVLSDLAVQYLKKLAGQWFEEPIAVSYVDVERIP